MPRPPRIHFEGAVYYVTAKGSNNQEIFKDKADYKMYLDLLKKYKTQHKFKLFSYCLLPDRIHLLIETGDDATISEIMHDLSSIYTKYFNGRYQRRGPLFESRFKSVLVEKTQHLLAMTRFIHQIPKIVEAPYSSFLIYKAAESSSSVIASDDSGLNLSEEIKEVMNFLENRENPDAYERYCLAGKEEVGELEKKLKRGSILGTEAFAQEVRGRFREFSNIKEGQAAATKPNKTLIFIIGFTFLVVTSSAVSLYIGKKTLEDKYKALLRQKESEFTEKTRFENRSPLALTELEGTVWEIEILPLSADKAAETSKDKIHFVNGRFYSDAFAAKGFGAVNFTLTRHETGIKTWETMQTSSDGSTISWQGDWQGDAMKGVLSHRPAGEKPRDFSFFSVKWSHQNGRGAGEKK